MLSIGSTLAGYRIKRVIGTGRMSTVYLAQSPDLPRDDALKVANSDLVADTAFRDRFVREANIGAQLDHPNIVSVYRRGTDDGHLWIARQYVNGLDADTALCEGKITAADAVHIIACIAAALDHAHGRAIIHRDVKPANFLISESGHVLLSDFGIARQLDQHESTDDSVVATLAYAAPEVLAGRPADGSADIYSLGCSLFRLLTGNPPFSGEGDTDTIIARHLHEPPPRVSTLAADLPPAVDDVLARVLAKDPAARFPSATEFADAAAAALQQGTSPAHTPRSTAGAATTTPQPPALRSSLTPDLAHEPALTPAAEVTGRRFEIPTVTPQPRLFPRTVDRAKITRIAGAAVGGLALIVGVVVWATTSDEHSPDATASSPTSTTPTRNPEAETRLLQALPQNYPPNACTPVAPTEAAQASAQCSVSAAPGTPPAAVTHMLMADGPALQTALTDIEKQLSIVPCPGNIQSPGPWRHTSAQQVAGTLVCGFQNDRPTVAWSTEDSHLVSIIQTQPAGATLDQLYSWWSYHS